MCGFWPRAGDAATRLNVLLPAFTPRAQPYPPVQAWGYGEKLRARGLRNTAAGLPTAALPDEILLEGEGRVRALFCLGGNPMLAFPDQRRTEAALRRLDLLVTFDPELSATARLAHYVIAPRLTLETPGMTQAAELLKYFGASSGFGPPYAQYAPAVLSPPAGSDLIEEWEFFYELARRLGLPLQLVGFYGWGRHVESPPVVVPLDMERRPTTDELYALLTTGSRVPLAAVKRHPHGHVFDEVRDVVHAREPGCDARLELGDADMLRELAQVAAEDWRGAPRDFRASISAGAASLEPVRELERPESRAVSRAGSPGIRPSCIRTIWRRSGSRAASSRASARGTTRSSGSSRRTRRCAAASSR